MTKYLLLLTLVALVCAKDKHLPSEFQICKKSDPNLDECVSRAIEKAMPVLAKGIPEFKFEPAEPIHVPELTIGEGKGAVNVVQKYKNVEIYGIPSIKVLKSHASPEGPSPKLHADVYFDEIRLEADYDLNGKVLILPVVGTGKCTLKLQNITAELDIAIELREHKGKQYGHIEDFKIKLKVGKIIFNFRNLFNGDEQLGNQVNNLLNDRDQDVWEDVRPGYEEALGLIFKNKANIIFSNVPYDEIFSK